MGSVTFLLLLLPGVLLGLCAEESLLPGRRLLLQSGLEEIVLGDRHRAWPLDLEDLPSLESGFLGVLQEPQLDPECKELLNAFANSSLRLAGCLMQSARPVTLCQNCYHQFGEVMQQFNNIEVRGSVSLNIGVSVRIVRGFFPRDSCSIKAIPVLSGKYFC